MVQIAHGQEAVLRVFDAISSMGIANMFVV